MCSVMILYTLSTESTLMISIAEMTSASLRLLLMHLTKCPFPLTLFCLLQTADLTLTVSGEGARDKNASIIDVAGMTPFSLFFVAGCET